MCIELQQDVLVYWTYETFCWNVPVFKYCDNIIIFKRDF